MRFIGKIALQLVPALIILWVAAAFVDRAWAAVCPFDGYIVDGPFQLYDALRRIDAGQFPVRDFPAFHGAGVPWIHYPLYRQLGGGLYGSEFARQLLTPLATLLVYVIASVCLTKSLWPAAIWSVLTLFVWPIVGLALPLGQLVEPDVSQYGFRGLARLLAIVLLWRNGPIVAGLAMGAAFLFGIEHGVFLAAAIFATAVATWIVRRGLPSVKGPPLARTFMLGIAIALVAMALATGGAQDRAMMYYFQDIPQAQVWYFGSPPNEFLGNGEPDNAKRVVYVLIAAAGLLVGWLASLFAARRATDKTQLRGSTVFAVGCLYGLFTLTTNLGIFRPQFYHLAARVIAILVSAWLYVRIRDWVGKRFDFNMPAVGIAGLVVSVALAFLVVRFSMSRWHEPKPADLSPGWARLANEFPQVIRKAVPDPKTGVIWSTYASIVEDRLGILHPHEDYIIHALGKRRAGYVDDFKKLQPLFVQTMRRDAMKYEEWLQTTTWDFYQRVLENYDIVAQSDYSLLWKRTDKRWREPSPEGWTNIPLQAGADRVTVPVDDAEANLAIVRLEYEAIMPWKKLPLIGQQPRFLVAMPGSRSAYPASLPPRQTVHEFPVPLYPGQPFTLEFQIRGIAPGAELRIKSVAVRFVTVSEVNRAFLNPGQ